MVERTISTEQRRRLRRLRARYEHKLELYQEAARDLADELERIRLDGGSQAEAGRLLGMRRQEVLRFRTVWTRLGKAA